MKAKILIALTLVMGLAVTGATAQVASRSHDRTENRWHDNGYSNPDGRFYENDSRFNRHHLSRRERRRLMRERRMAMRRHYMYMHRHHRAYSF